MFTFIISQWFTSYASFFFLNISFKNDFDGTVPCNGVTGMSVTVIPPPHHLSLHYVAYKLT